jgi:esterase/lipase
MFKFISAFILLSVVVYLSGPVMPDPVLNNVLPVVSEPIADFVNNQESKERIKPDNEAKIVWANDSTHSQTEYVLLYLHGFSASRQEGYPVNEDFAKRYGCNAYLSRLASHGLITEDPLLDMTPEKYYDSAKQALVIATHLGKKIVIMGTSSGGTLALKLAADFPNLVYATILYSPNVQIKQKASILLTKPWGLQIARLNFGGKYRVTSTDFQSDKCNYWYCKYRAEGTVYLQQLMDVTMDKATFSKVKCPLFVGYYYKDEQNQDEVVDVQAALKMYEEVGTPKDQKRSVAFPNAGEHVIACKLTSKSVAEVAKATYDFSESILKMVPVR